MFLGYMYIYFTYLIDTCLCGKGMCCIKYVVKADIVMSYNHAELACFRTSRSRNPRGFLWQLLGPSLLSLFNIIYS